MNKLFKKCLAGVLSFAMVLTLLPAMPAKAADGVDTTTLTASKVVASGGQNNSNASTYLVATGATSNTGSADAAAYTSNVTASSSTTVLGSARKVGIGFELPTNIANVDLISNATLTINVESVNQNMGDASKFWTKAALFAVDASSYEGMSTDDSTFAAKNGDYSATASVYSNEKIISSELGNKTFDVTDWVKESLKAGDTYSVFRLQTVIAGWCFYFEGENAPTLSITTVTEEGAANVDAENLSVPAKVRGDISLPTSGDCGSTITWASDNTAVITNDGKVTRPEVDTEVKLTATVTNGSFTTTKEFTVVVVKVSDGGLVAAYDFNTSDVEDKVIADTSGNGYDAALEGTGATVEDGMLMLPGGAAGSSAAYVSIPGEVFEGKDTLTINLWLKNETGSGDFSAMFFGTPTTHIGGGTAGMPINYWLLNPSKGGKFKSVWTDGNNSSAPYNTETATSSMATTAEWSMYTTVITADSITGYYNGNVASTAAKTKTTTDFGTDLVAFIGRSSYNDKFYQGGVYGVTVYETALTQQQIWDEYYGNMPSAIDKETLYTNTANTLFADMLGENTEADVITSDLVFPTEKDGLTLEWSSSDTTAITNDGKYVYAGADSAEVTITVTAKMGETVAFTKNTKVTARNLLSADYAALTIPNMEGIKGNITLPTVGIYGAAITWASSNEDVISVKDVANEGYDSTPAGVVTRLAEDATVTLTATLSDGTNTKEKSFDVIVKAATTVAETTDYVMAYFVGDGAGQEKIYLATSRDGLNWQEINGGNVFIESTMATKGLRDPYIMRSAEGDKFYMIATDLCIGSGTSWGDAQTAGSQAIMVWESDDLVNWSEQRMATVSAEIEAGCTWAPEFFYDDKTGEYIVFWASKVKADNYSKQRLYYSKTRDFYTFTEPQVWIDMDGISTIDTTVVRDDDGTYYRFTKNENGDQKRIFMEKSDSMLGTWTAVNSTSLYNEQWVEGPCCFRFNADDRENAGAQWCLLLDNYGSGGYYPVVTSNLAAEEVEFTKLSANLPQQKKPRHGTVLPITQAEYTSLMMAYGTEEQAKEALVENAMLGLTVAPAEMALTEGTTGNIAVTYPETLTKYLEDNNTTATVKYRTSRASVATVKDGIITAVAEGNAVITTTVTVDGVSMAFKTAVTVSKKAVENVTPNPPAPVVEDTKITLDIASATIGVKEKIAIEATVTGKGAGQAITWTSSNSKIADFQNGKLVGKKAGKTTITATVDGKSVTCAITVKKAPNKVSVKKKTLTVKRGKTATIKVKLPKNTASYAITYKSNKKKIATVDAKGVVTGLKKGKAVITVQTFNKKKVKVTVKVK